MDVGDELVWNIERENLRNSSADGVVNRHHSKLSYGTYTYPQPYTLNPSP